MKKIDFKAGLSFGIGMTIYFIIQNLWTSDVMTLKTIVVAIVSGAAAGFTFALIISWFKSSKYGGGATKIDTMPDEDILFETAANHFKGAEDVGGKLYLTNKRVHFKSHKFNIQNHEVSIYLTDIDHVERYKNVGIFNTGLTIKSKDNKVDKFVVEKAGEWVKKLGK